MVVIAHYNPLWLRPTPCVVLVLRLVLRLMLQLGATTDATTCATTCAATCATIGATTWCYGTMSVLSLASVDSFDSQLFVVFA